MCLCGCAYVELITSKRKGVCSVWMCLHFLSSLPLPLPFDVIGDGLTL